MPSKVSLSGSGTLARVAFSPRLGTSYSFNNDGAAAVTIALDDALYTVPAGQGIDSDPGESLDSFAVTANAGSSAWRFLGAV